MGLFDLFSKGEQPVGRYEDDLLGPMTWSADDDAWAGEVGGVRYRLAYERQATPRAELLEYARTVLADPVAFEGAIARAKAAAAAAHPRLADEIAGLRVGTATFYRHRAGGRILIDLEGGRDDRSWRVEFGEDGCEGLGFDT